MKIIVISLIALAMAGCQVSGADITATPTPNIDQGRITQRSEAVEMYQDTTLFMVRNPKSGIEYLDGVHGGLRWYCINPVVIGGTGDAPAFTGYVTTDPSNPTHVEEEYPRQWGVFVGNNSEVLKMGGHARCSGRLDSPTIENERVALVVKEISPNIDFLLVHVMTEYEVRKIEMEITFDSNS